MEDKYTRKSYETDITHSEEIHDIECQIIEDDAFAIEMHHTKMVELADQITSYIYEYTNANALFIGEFIDSDDIYYLLNVN